VTSVPPPFAESRLARSRARIARTRSARAASSAACDACKRISSKPRTRFAYSSRRSGGVGRSQPGHGSTVQDRKRRVVPPRCSRSGEMPQRPPSPSCDVQSEARRSASTAAAIESLSSATAIPTGEVARSSASGSVRLAAAGGAQRRGSSERGAVRSRMGGAASVVGPTRCAADAVGRGGDSTSGEGGCARSARGCGTPAGTSTM
jgi:hypothetical protein